MITLNSKTKCSSAIKSNGSGIIKLHFLFQSGQSSAYIKFPIQNSAKRTAAAKGKSESTICETREEANMFNVIKLNREKSLSPGK